MPSLGLGDDRSIRSIPTMSNLEWPWWRRVWTESKVNVKFYVLQPVLCHFGRHDVVDVIERDASVIHGICLGCFADTPPKRPRD